MKALNEVDLRETLVPLEPLDLKKVHTVSDLVDAMSRCSFGARMLGEVAETLTSWTRANEKPVIIYDGMDSSLGGLLRAMVGCGWFSGVFPSDEYLRWPEGRDLPAMVVGTIPERYEAGVHERAPEAIYINQYGQARPGLVRDGSFRNVVFSDPRFIIPILERVLLERVGRRDKEPERTTVSQFIGSISDYGGLAAQVAEGAEVLRKMVTDPDCRVFLTIAGAMTVAKMGLLICDMIDDGMVHYVASTGALIAHGLVESIGLKHYKYDPAYADELLAAQKVNRVTDTLEPEENFDEVEDVVGKVLEKFSGRRPLSSCELHWAIGKYLAEHFPAERGILKSAYEKGVPVCVPAFIDSEIGNDVFVHNLKRRREKRPAIVMDMEKDTELLIRMITGAKRAGIFSIGGGVPRNNTQNVAPLIEIMKARGVGSLPMRKFFYGCRIDPTPLWYGNLSGCTYSEGGSWRKIDFNGCFSEIHADATIVWPFLLKYVQEIRSHL